MSPRGVAIPEVKEQLFAAAERVLAREGAVGLTSRAITQEAGVAKGLLYRHFQDLDGFLAELLLDRAGLAAEEAGRLPETAGSGTVAGNITEAATSWLGSHSFALASLLLARPALITRVHERSGGRAPAAVDQVEAAFAAYLAAEQRLGRVAATADTGTLALALVGTVHHVFLTHAARDPEAREQVERIVSAVLSGQVIDAPGGRS